MGDKDLFDKQQWFMMGSCLGVLEGMGWGQLGLVSSSLIALKRIGNDLLDDFFENKDKFNSSVLSRHIFLLLTSQSFHDICITNLF